MPEIVGRRGRTGTAHVRDGDVVYLNAGSQQGIKEGQTFRSSARAATSRAFTSKNGLSGHLHQEVGQLQVFKVRENTSARRSPSPATPPARRSARAVPDRESPLQRAEAISMFSPIRQVKQTGRLMWRKTIREMVTRNDVVYIDLGSEDIGKARRDYLTFYRPLGTGNITRVDAEEMGRNRCGLVFRATVSWRRYRTSGKPRERRNSFCRRYRPLSRSTDPLHA
jgi:hypothetical protein